MDFKRLKYQYLKHIYYYLIGGTTGTNNDVDILIENLSNMRPPVLNTTSSSSIDDVVKKLVSSNNIVDNATLLLLILISQENQTDCQSLIQTACQKINENRQVDATVDQTVFNKIATNAAILAIPASSTLNIASIDDFIQNFSSKDKAKQYIVQNFSKIGNTRVKTFLFSVSLFFEFNNLLGNDISSYLDSTINLLWGQTDPSSTKLS